MNFLKIAVLALAVAVFAVSCTQTTEMNKANEDHSNQNINGSPEVEKTPDELAIGESKYKEFCARCHKDDGTGGKVEIEGKTLKPEDLTAEDMVKEPDSEYLEYMEKGIPDEGMPSFKDEMSADEMKAVVKYIREKLQ